MKTVNMHEAKTHLSRLVARALRGEEVVIAKAGKPVVKIVPVEREKKERVWGTEAGKIVIHEGFDDPLPEFEEYM